MQILPGILLALSIASCVTTELSSDTSAIATTPVAEEAPTPDPTKCQYHEATECAWERIAGDIFYCATKSFKWTPCDHNKPVGDDSGNCGNHQHASKTCPSARTAADCKLTDTNNICLWKYITTDDLELGGVCENDPEACGLAVEESTIEAPVGVE